MWWTEETKDDHHDHDDYDHIYICVDSGMKAIYLCANWLLISHSFLTRNFVVFCVLFSVLLINLYPTPC